VLSNTDWKAASYFSATVIFWLFLCLNDCGGLLSAVAFTVARCHCRHGGDCRKHNAQRSSRSRILHGIPPVSQYCRAYLSPRYSANETAAPPSANHVKTSLMPCCILYHIKIVVRTSWFARATTQNPDLLRHILQYVTRTEIYLSLFSALSRRHCDAQASLQTTGAL